MSDPRPQALPTDDAQDAPELASVAAEEVIRRAIVIDERRRDLIPLAEIKSTLATLGIPGETVDRAAAEVRKETVKGAPRTLTDVVTHLFSFALFSLPALYAVDAGSRAEGFRQFWMVGLGVIWGIFCLGGMMDAVYVWARRNRG